MAEQAVNWQNFAQTRKILQELAIYGVFCQYLLCLANIWHILARYAVNWQNISKTGNRIFVVPSAFGFQNYLSCWITVGYGKADKNSPPYERGVGAASADGVVL